MQILFGAFTYLVMSITVGALRASEEDAKYSVFQPVQGSEKVNTATTTAEKGGDNYWNNFLENNEAEDKSRPLLDVNSNRQLKALGTKGTKAPGVTKASKKGGKGANSVKADSKGEKAAKSTKAPDAMKASKAPKGGKGANSVKADSKDEKAAKSTKAPDVMKASKAPKGGKSVKADDALSTRMDTKSTKSSKSENIAKTVPAPHEVHQFEQTKFYDEPEWDCRFDNIQEIVGCLVCKNPREKGDDALIVEVKAMYKRADWNIKDETVNKPRKHCIYPEHGEFWTCFNSNLVIEPDTTWLPDGIKDKPIYKNNGEACTNEEVAAGDCVCYPGSMVNLK